MNKIIFLLIGLFFLSCFPKENQSKEANMSCYNFHIKGQFKNATYTFCGIVPVESKYTYKNGKWKFWNLKGQLIAEGVYKVQKAKMENQGGCPYEIKEGIIDKEKWKFWDDNGYSVKSNKELISKIEICTDKLNISKNEIEK